jgi:hypothetical protein
VQEESRMRFIKKLWLLPLTLALGLPLLAQDDQGQNQDQNSSPVRTARISFVTGAVTVASNGESFAAQLNMPAVAGQRIATGDDGQAEVEFEDGSVVRLTPNSSVSLNALNFDSSNRTSTRIQSLSGLLYFETRASGASSYLIDAAGEQISPQENAVFRVGMDALPAEISVLQGAITVSRQGGFSTVLRGGETLRGDADDNTRYFLSQGVPEQTWDRWNEDRDQDALNESNLRTEARDNLAGNQGYGWSDLDAYGNWYDLPGEGRVWQPSGGDASGFDPYGNGSWVYYPNGGYIWASAYPWGWTPFRCGNWNYWNGFGWGWQAAGCNTFGAGWGYGGYGNAYLRIRRPPQGYHPPMRPVAGPGPRRGEQYHPRPIVSVHNGFASNAVRVHEFGRPAIFNGHPVTPLRRMGGYTQRGGSAVGGGLRRDFPVDPGTRQPVMGIAPQPNATIVPGAGWRSVGGRPTTGAQPAPATAGRPANGAQQPAPGTSRPNWNGPGNGVHGHEPNHTASPTAPVPAPTTGPAPATRPDWNVPRNHHQQIPDQPGTAVPQQPRPGGSMPGQVRPAAPTVQPQQPAVRPAPTVQPTPAAPTHAAPALPQQQRPAFQPAPQQPQPQRPAPMQQPNFRPGWTPPAPRPAPPPPAPRAAPAPAAPK